MPIPLQDPLVRSALHDVRIPTTKSFQAEAASRSPVPIRLRRTGGTTGNPCRVVPFTLQPMQIQILGRPFP